MCAKWSACSWSSFAALLTILARSAYVLCRQVSKQVVAAAILVFELFVRQLLELLQELTGSGIETLVGHDLVFFRCCRAGMGVPLRLLSLDDHLERYRLGRSRRCDFAGFVNAAIFMVLSFRVDWLMVRALFMNT